MHFSVALLCQIIIIVLATLTTQPSILQKTEPTSMANIQERSFIMIKVWLASQVIDTL